MYHDTQFLNRLRSGVEVMRAAAAAEKTPREAKFIYTSIAVILAGWVYFKWLCFMRS